MAGKKKQEDREYNPNWGGSRDNSGRPKRKYIENVKEIMAEHIDQNMVMDKPFRVSHRYLLSFSKTPCS